MKYAFIASSHQVAFLFLPEKPSESPAFTSVGHVVISSLGGRGAGSKGSFSSLVILILGSETGAGDCSGIVVVVRETGSSGLGNEHCGVMFRFLQALCILHSVLPPGEPVVPDQ